MVRVVPAASISGSSVVMTASDGAGTAWPYASVQVNVHGGGAASPLWLAAGHQGVLANPLTADANGGFSFFAAEGDYDVVMTSPLGASRTVWVSLTGGVGSNFGWHQFPFFWNTPGLTAGVPVYTPTPGDVVLYSWIAVPVAWDGTTPKANWGQFVGTTAGVSTTPWDLTATDVPADGGAGGLVASFNAGAGALHAIGGIRIVSADSIKVVVSQSGASGGAAVGGTHGSGVLYLVTITPS